MSIFGKTVRGPALRRSALCLLAGLLVSSPIRAGIGDVIYLAEQDTDGVVELYHMAPKSGVVTKLNGALVAGGDVSSFQSDPKGKSVVYLADQDTQGVDELYRADLKSGEVTKVNMPLVAADSIEVFGILGND